MGPRAAVVDPVAVRVARVVAHRHHIGAGGREGNPYVLVAEGEGCVELRLLPSAGGEGHRLRVRQGAGHRVAAAVDAQRVVARLVRAHIEHDALQVVVVQRAGGEHHAPLEGAAVGVAHGADGGVVAAVADGVAADLHHAAEHTLHHGRLLPVFAIFVYGAVRREEQAARHAAVVGEAHRIHAAVVAADENPDVRGGRHGGGKLHGVPGILVAGAYGVGGRGRRRLVAAAGVDGEVVRAGRVSIEHYRRHLLGGVESRCRQFDAAGIGREADKASVAVGHSVATADGHTPGGEAVAAAVGVYLARVAGGTVGPAVEAVALGQGSPQHHRVAEGEAGGGGAAGAVIHRHRRTCGGAALHRARDGGGPRGAPCRVGAYAYEHRVVEVEGIGGVAAGAAGAGVESPDGVVVVVAAAPTPVDVEVAVVVIAVEHKAVSTALVPARVEDRALLVELAAKQGAVFGVAVEPALHIGHIGTVFEILHQRSLRRRFHRRAIGVVGAAGHRAVGHLVGHADVVHQGGHGVDLRRGARARQGVGHLRPLVGRGAEVGRQVVVGVLRAVHGARGAVGMAAVARGGVVVVFHHLRRGRGHTARHRTLGIAAVGGAEGVVVGALVPRGGHQRGHRCRHHGRRHGAVEQLAPGPGKRRLLFHTSHLQGRGGYIPGRVAFPPHYLTLVTLEEAAYVRRHVLGHETVVDAVGQHGLHAVVAADEGETTLGGGEDVELRERSLRRNILQGSGILHTLRLQPGLRHAARHILRHRTGNARQRERQQHKKDNRPFHNIFNLIYYTHLTQCQHHTHNGHTPLTMQTYTLFCKTATFFLLTLIFHSNIGKKHHPPLASPTDPLRTLYGPGTAVLQ